MKPLDKSEALWLCWMFEPGRSGRRGRRDSKFVGWHKRWMKRARRRYHKAEAARKWNLSKNFVDSKSTNEVTAMSKDIVNESVVKESGLPVSPEPRTVTRDGQDITVETRTGTGATIPGVKSIACESGLGPPVLHEVVVPAAPVPTARIPVVGDAVAVDGHEGHVSKTENGVVTEVTLSDGQKVPGTGFTYR